MSTVRDLLGEVVEIGAEEATRRLKNKASKVSDQVHAEILASIGIRLIQAAAKRAPGLLEKVVEYLKKPHKGNPKMMKWMGWP